MITVLIDNDNESHYRLSTRTTIESTDPGMRAALKGISLALSTLVVSGAALMGKVVNIYSSRHYQTDEALYSGFTKATGIKVNRIEAGEDALIERIRNEGARSPADVMITVDAGRLWRAEQLGLFQPVKSSVLRRASRRTCASRAASGSASRNVRE